MKKNNISDWEKEYVPDKRPGWDIGYCSTPLKDYFDQLINKDEKYWFRVPVMLMKLSIYITMVFTMFIYLILH